MDSQDYCALLTRNADLSSRSVTAWAARTGVLADAVSGPVA